MERREKKISLNRLTSHYRMSGCPKNNYNGTHAILTVYVPMHDRTGIESVKIITDNGYVKWCSVLFTKDYTKSYLNVYRIGNSLVLFEHKKTKQKFIVDVRINKLYSDSKSPHGYIDSMIGDGDRELITRRNKDGKVEVAFNYNTPDDYKKKVERDDETRVAFRLFEKELA